MCQVCWYTGGAGGTGGTGGEVVHVVDKWYKSSGYTGVLVHRWFTGGTQVSWYTGVLVHRLYSVHRCPGTPSVLSLSSVWEASSY